MRTTRSILVIALLTLGAFIYAQGSEVEYITANYLEKTNRFEILLSKVSDFTDRFSKNEIDEPVCCASYIVAEANFIYEEDYITESWMTAPFESSLGEAELEMENWMTAPFEGEETIELEDWMTVAWI